MQVLRIVSIALILAACGGGSGAKPTSTTQPRPTCSSIAKKVALVMIGQVDKDAPVIAYTTGIARESCEKDRWSTEVLACWSAASTDAADTACAKRTPKCTWWFGERCGCMSKHGCQKGPPTVFEPDDTSTPDAQPN